MARRPNAAAVVANRIAIAGMNPPPKVDHRDERGEAAENEQDRLRIEAFALGKFAAPARR